MSALATLTDLKTYLGITSTADDALLSRLVSASSEWFERQTGMTFTDPIPADVTQAVIEISALKYRERTRLGKMSETIGGESISYQTMTIPVSIQSVVDAWKRIPGL